MLDIEYHILIWQMLPQLSCGETCQIWMWFKECNRYFCKIENFPDGEIDKQTFSNPYPLILDFVQHKMTKLTMEQPCMLLILYCQ